jgi:hypothetical protein
MVYCTALVGKFLTALKPMALVRPVTAVLAVVLLDIIKS